MSTSRFSRIHFCAAALLSLSVPAFAADSPADSTKKKKWDVTQPFLPSDTLSFETTEGTWVTVDVSPDGTNLAFDILGDIYTMPIAGGEAKLLAGGLAWEIQPRWSPNGKQILFTSDRGGGDNIWIMNADGSNLQQITKESYRLLNNATWHPSGDYIVAKKHFTSERSMGAGEMWMYKVPEGGAGVQLTKRKNDQMDVNEPVFSPDGKYLYWSEDMSPGQYFEYNKDPNGTIYMIRRLDMQAHEIDNMISVNGGACRPQVSPDGKTISFVRRVRGKSVLSLFNPDNAGIRELWNGLDEDQQETWSLFGVYPGYSWTPDGKQIVIWAKGKLWRVDVVTGIPAEIPFHANVTQTVTKALRFANDIGGPTFPVKVIRWPQPLGTSGDLIFQALGYLYRKSANGSPTRLTHQTEYYEFAPSVSPDGKQVVYVTWNDTAAGTIRIMSADGKSSRVLVSRPGHYASASFSPDGQSVVYHRGGGDGYRGRLWTEDQGIYIIDALGKSAPKFLTREGEKPLFSKDGQRIFLQSYEDENTALVSVNLLGSDRRVHATSEHASDFALSPDEKWLAFEELWQTYLIPYPATSSIVEVSPEMTALPVKQLSKDAGTYLNWSRDSKRVYWSLGPELFSIDAAVLYETDTTKKAVPSTVNLGWNEPADMPSTDVYFVGARILPMYDLSSISDGVVHVKGNKIAEVGTTDQIKVPAGARTVDVTGKTVMPGFVDVHAHTGSSNQGVYTHQNWALLANLAFGVTTTYDPSNNSQMIFAEGELMRKGDLLAPRVLSTGTILYGAEGGFKTVINSYDDAVSAIKRTAAWGAIGVKSYNQPRREQRQMVIKAANEQKIMVMPEGGSTMHNNLNQILDGHTTIEHAIPVAPLYEPELQLFSFSRTGYTPTLIVGYGGLWGENYWYENTDVWLNQRLSHFVPRSVLDPRSIRRPMAPDSEYHHFALTRTASEILKRGGIVELGAHGQLQGLGVHWELWMLAQGGMSNHEALRCGTYLGAKVLGLDNQIGSIQPGLLADFIVIDGDPLSDIRQSENVSHTVINGRVFNAMTLEQIEPSRKPLPKGPNLDRLLPADAHHDCLGN